MSTSSRFVPVPFRHRLRPVYRLLQKSAIGAADCVRTSAIWPRPKSIKTVLGELVGQPSTGDLYRIGQREFGILQVEAEITEILEYVALDRPRTVGEIGLKHGGNSFLFLRKFQDLQLFVGLDLLVANSRKLRYLAMPGQRLKFLEGNSYAPETVARVGAILGARQFDFLFIDGDHSYAGVCADLQAYYRFVRPGGLIAFHDIVPDEMARFGVRPESSSCYGGDVYRLWNTLKHHFEYREFVADWEQIGFGIGVIRKPLGESQLPSGI